MNLKYMVGCMFLIALSTQSIFCSDSENDCESENYECIDKNQTQEEDQIFAILQRNDSKALDKYLKQNPQAINARTPYETEEVQSSRGKITGISDGWLPFHIPLKKIQQKPSTKKIIDSNNPAILCLQVLLNHTREYNRNNHVMYQKTIEKEHNFNENNSYHDSTPFLQLALRLPTQHNNLFTRLVHISSQREKDMALEDAIDHAHGYHCSDSYLYEPKIEILRNNEANINHTIWYGRTTMLHRAFRDGRLPKAMAIIEKYKPDMTCKDDDGQTPFDYYQENKTKLYENIEFHGTTAEKVDKEIKQVYEQQMLAKQQQLG